MQVNGIQNFSTPCFAARKSDIRRADKIERTTRNVFPMISATYVQDLYSCSRYPSKRRIESKYYTDKIQKKILKMRDMEEFPKYFGIEVVEPEKSTLYATYLNGMKQLKMGNCKESSIAALAVLSANGFYDSELAELCLQSDFVNSDTGETEFSVTSPVDHAFALTDMNSGKEKDIVIDPWLGFADSISGAVARYKNLYTEVDYADIKYFQSMRFYYHLKAMNQEDMKDKYEQRVKLVVKPSKTKTSKQELEKLGKYANANFEGVKLKI